MKKYKTLVPSYMKNFTCIASDCEDSCCKGWKIDVDKSVYKKFKNLRKTPYANFINDNIVKENSEKNVHSYYIKLREDGLCPFLDDNMLCNIYLKYGDAYMPYICMSYPREVSCIDDEYEMSLSLSCPEAARIALLNENIMEFETVYMDLGKYNLHSNISTKHNILKKEHKYFWNIRIASITILQNRKFNIGIRLVILGILYDKIQKLIDNSNYIDIPICISDFMNLVEVGAYDNAFLNIKRNLNIQMQMCEHFFKNFMDEHSKFYGDMPKFLKDVYEMFSLDNNFEIYKKINDEIFLSFMYNSWGNYMIENFIVNLFFYNLMPFSNSFDNLNDCLIYISASYAIIKSLAIAQVYKSNSIDKDTFLYIIVAFSKNLIHMRDYHKIIGDFLKSYNLDSLGGIYTLSCD